MYKKLLLVSLSGGFFLFGTNDEVRAAEQTTYASKTNAPVFYGTKKAIIDKGDTFDINDAKFRVFARDYEDGDVKVKVVSNNVDTKKAGTYEVKYETVDSDQNKNTFTTTVEVVDDTKSQDKVDTIIRKMYNNTSTWNLKSQGINRGDSHDRQMVGVLMAPGQEIEAKVIKGPNIRVSVVTNDSWKDGATVTVKKDEFTKIQTDQKTDDHDNKSDPDTTAVPFAYTPMNSKAEGNQKQDIEVEYRIPDDVKSVVYYHEGDNEQEFFKEWKDRQNDKDYAVIDGDALTVLVPSIDKDKLVNYWKKHFDTLDDFLNYYDKVRDNFEEMLGTKLYPDQLIDQRTNTKYFVRANAHGAGAAYYGGDHVGVNKQSVASFFEPNWGGLHEFGHGYQGTLRGNNEFPLGEVSNNFFGYYTQTDSNIYKWSDRYLNLDKSENTVNKKRLENKQAFNQYNVDDSLYILVNLLDSFEKPKEVYADINKWYRRYLAEGKTIDAQDAWARSIAVNQHVNVLPYFDAWGIPVTAETKEYITHLDDIDTGTILADVVPADQLEAIAKELDTRSYGLVTTSQLKKFNLNGEATIQLSDEAYKAAAGKILLIKNGDKVVKRVKITQKNLTVTLPVGEYQILLPTLDENYTFDVPYIQVSAQKESTVQATYTKNSNKGTLPADKLEILGGRYDTTGFMAQTNTVTGKVDITLGGADLGNQSENDSNKGQVASSVTFIDGETNKEIKKYEVKYGKGEYYSYIKDSEGNQVPKNQTIDVKIGDKMKVYHFKPERVRFFNGYDQQVDEQNIDSTSQENTYVLTTYGWRLEKRNESDFNQAAYNRYSKLIKERLDDGIKSIPETKVDSRFALANQKSELIYLYKQLNADDQKSYKNYMDRLIQGGKPVITLNTTSDKVKENTIQLEQNETPDWYSLINVTDNEDGDYPADVSNTTVSKVDTSKVGKGKVTFTVKDSDGNQSELTVSYEVAGKSPIYHEDNRYASVIKDNYTLWSDLDFKKKKGTTKAIYHKTVKVKGYYTHPNGSTYASLYDKDDKWLGYLNVSGLEYQKNAGGKYYSVNKYAAVVKNNYTLWNDFDFKKKKGNTKSLYKKTVYVKGEYRHFNGSTYVTIYDKDNKWLGYLNVSGLEYQKNAGGKYYSVNKYAAVVKNNYTLWNDFDFKKKKGNTKSLYKKTVYVKGEYHHFNGSTYVTIYDKDNKWLGYLNVSGIEYQKNAGGKYYSVNKYASVIKNNYTLWNDFDFKKKKGNTKSLYKKTVYVKGEYHHFNGSTYVSIYDKKNGKLLGYMNIKGIKL